MLVYYNSRLFMLFNKGVQGITGHHFYLFIEKIINETNL